MWHPVVLGGRVLRGQRQQLHTFLHWLSCCEVLTEKCVRQNIFSSVWALEKHWLSTLWHSLINLPATVPVSPSTSAAKLAVFQIISLSAAILPSDTAALKRQQTYTAQALLSALWFTPTIVSPKDHWEDMSAASCPWKHLCVKTTVDLLPTCSFTVRVRHLTNT